MNRTPFEIRRDMLAVFAQWAKDHRKRGELYAQESGAMLGTMAVIVDLEIKTAMANLADALGRLNEAHQIASVATEEVARAVDHVTREDK